MAWAAAGKQGRRPGPTVLEEVVDRATAKNALEQEIKR